MSAAVVMGVVWLLILAGLGDSQRPQARLPAESAAWHSVGVKCLLTFTDSKLSTPTRRQHS